LAKNRRHGQQSVKKRSANK